ncbi:Protein TRANSPARENT TESTA [Trema orientale]|uniref:Protein TRANSPARENT TESTA n=1 Tax=Trema orientale TaxID=63057 RepID=A0A2P5ALA3_TREOI|nr:Protein TRANSPARENT TESTA [Trema orientale]
MIFDIVKSQYYYMGIYAMPWVSRCCVGLWIGMLCGVLAQTIALIFIIWKTDWEGQRPNSHRYSYGRVEYVNKASERLNRWFLKPTDEIN